MPAMKWTNGKILEEIQSLGPRLCYSTYVKKNNGALWKAAQRRFGSWGTAVDAAGYDYESIIKWGPREAPNKGVGGLCTFPGCTEKHHANGLCQRHDNEFRYRKKLVGHN